MLTSIATVSLSGTLEEKLQAVARAGFDGVEIFENDLLAFPGPATDVGRMIAEVGMRCTLFQPLRDFEGLPAELRARMFERVERKFDVMEQLGTDLLLVCSSVSSAATGDLERIADDFRELGERAAARGLRVGYEALAWGRHVWDHRQAWDIVKAVDHPAIGIILDSFHSLVRRIPVESLRDIEPAKIFIVQVADAPWLDMDYLPWSRHFRNLPGQGEIPVKGYVSELIDIGYRGPLSLEIFNDYFRSIPAWSVALDGIRSLRLTIDECSRAVGVTMPDPLPPRVQCRGVVFVEFALSQPEAETFCQMLRALGFGRIGRHRSKAVERWAQGGVNIVVNTEFEGFAHSHHVVHGPSACAIALRVNDVEAAIGRAAALSINSFEGRIGRGEMPVQAIRDVSGSLIYLVEDGREEEMWHRDFEPLDDVPPAGAGITGFDHLAYAMREQELLSWLLHYFAFFDLEKKPAAEIFDPLGLVHSQALEAPDRAFRLVLNGSTADNTLTARLHSRYWGAGLQYVSLRSDGIFATAEALDRLGLDRLKISANYYDDLETRFGLASEFVAQLAKWDILYDRDEGGGEYLQLNSRAFDKRFYFEVVERRGRYDEYGAANEVIKLTTQSRFKNDQLNAL